MLVGVFVLTVRVGGMLLLEISSSNNKVIKMSYFIQNHRKYIDKYAK